MFMYIIFDILKDFFAETKQVSLTVIFFFKKVFSQRRKIAKEERIVCIYTYVLWANSFTYLMADKQSSNCIFSLFFRNISETMEVKDQVSLIAIGKKHTCL